MRIAFLWLFRKRLHRWYVELQAQFPEDFPIGEASAYGPDCWHHDVPGCQGSQWLGSKHSFDNMMNCRCHRLEGWRALDRAVVRAE